MIDRQGVEWLPVEEAATRLGVNPSTLRSWKRRGKVIGHLVKGRLWVNMPSVMRSEHATRDAYLVQRGVECNNGA